MKRNQRSDPQRNTKKTRVSKETCPLCIGQCVEPDLSPRLYFGLAWIMSTPTHYHLIEHEPTHVVYLADRLISLTTDPHLLSSTIAQLQDLVKTKDITTLASKLSQNKHIHVPQELDFIFNFLQEIKSSTTFDLISSLSDLEFLLMTDIRFVRLLALLGTLPKDIVIIQEEEEAEEQQEPSTRMMPDYEELSTPELRAKLKSYGYKAGGQRKQMIHDLKHIFESLYRTPSPVQQTVQSDKENDGLDLALRTKIVQHLKQNKSLWDRILRYEHVSIQECHAGLDCKKSELKIVLDEYAAGNEFKKRKK